MYQPKLPYVPDGLLAEATLSNYQIQNLYDLMTDIETTCYETVGVVPTFHLRIELHPRSSVTPEAIEKINQLLQEELKFQ